MAGSGPSILVVASDRDERALIVSMLREAGFAAVAVGEHRDALAALRRECFAAAVIALSEDHGIALMRAARRRQPGLPALLVLEPAAMSLVAEDSATMIKHPLEPRQLLGQVFELVLPDADGCRAGPRHGDAAEYGIAAAKLACLHKRHATASAAGASRLVHDLARQIGEAARCAAASRPRSGLPSSRVMRMPAPPSAA